MTRVRLEIDEVQIHRPKKRWKLYFVIVAEHPTEEDKMIVTTLPQDPFKLSKRHQNSFQPVVLALIIFLTYHFAGTFFKNSARLWIRVLLPCLYLANAQFGLGPVG